MEREVCYNSRMEITLEELSARAECSLIDIRDENAYRYGHIPGAINIPPKQVEGFDFSGDKELILYCANGKASGKIVREMQERGYRVRSVKGGYHAWVCKQVADMDASKVAENAENSIRKRFHRKLFSRFAQAIVKYNLIRPNDKIAVCISGGKDSFLMAKLFQELKRHDKFPFELAFLVMDPGYSEENRKIIERNATLLNVPISVFETDIFENVFNIEKSPCYICARMRRGHLYRAAKDLGCNKIALGHHYDDVIETILMGMLYGAQVQTMMPKLKSSNFDGMELIRPMYFIREEDIKAWRDANELHFIQCACRFTEASVSDGGKRKKVKELIRSLKEEDPEIEQNIFKSMENVNLSTVIAYKDKAGKRHTFLEEYE